MRHSFTTPTATSFTTMTDVPYSADHNFSGVDGVFGDHQDYFSYSELLTDPMDSSSPSSDHLAAVAGSLGGAVTFSWDLSTSGSGPGFSVPVSASGFINPPHDFSSLRLLQSPSSVPYQQYPSSLSTEAYSHQRTTNHQLFNMTAPPPDNNILLAVSERHKDKRLVPVDKPTGDGYNWRKYGQKPIKNCKYSRSYYKCTHLNCTVKKQVQHSKAGRVTHIIYRGHHNHELPQPGRRANENYNHTPVPTDSEDSADAYMRFEEDEEEEACAEGSTGAASSEEGASSERVAGPKIVVQTRSEVELMDDGYKWRKYGQKVVRGNHNPRSYYKCTSNGCRVRKQVERSSMEPEAVTTTYEGKHDHDVPAGRHSSSRNAQQATFCYSTTASNVDMGSGHGDQRPMAFLRLKEEQILV